MAKFFEELIPKEDYIYWIDPTVARIVSGMVIKVEHHPRILGYHIITYLRNAKLQLINNKIPDELIILAFEEGVENITKQLLVPNRQRNILIFKPPTVVFTDKEEITSWMKKSLKKL